MNKKVIPAIILLATAAGAIGYWASKASTPHVHDMVKVEEAGKTYWTCSMHPQVRQDHPGTCPICGMKLTQRQDATPQADATEQKVLYWYDPMKPEVHFDKPGKSPFMDMELEPKYARAESGTIVEVDARMAQNLGMRTAEVKAGTFFQRIDATGSVAVDERGVTVVEARAAGWIERLDVRAEGDVVKAGQVVAGIYSPELMAAQEELTLARKLNDATLIDAAQTRLKLLNAGSGGRSSRQTSVIAPQGGVVTELLVRQGAQVTPGMPLIKLADLSRVWIIVEVPEAQASWIQTGKTAEATLRGLPGRTFEGRVDYVYPILDAATRTVKARVAFANSDGALKPGMYAEVTVFGGARGSSTLVPSEAVIQTGARTVVMVAEAEGRYRPVNVVLGGERAGETMVLEGLEPGQRVVVSGQFLLDSEASLLGAYNRMQPPAAADAGSAK